MEHPDNSVDKDHGSVEGGTTNSTVWNGRKGPDQLQDGTKCHFLHVSSLGSNLTFWSEQSKIFVRHLVFWTPFWIFRPEKTLFHIYSHKKLTYEYFFEKILQCALRNIWKQYITAEFRYSKYFLIRASLKLKKWLILSQYLARNDFQVTV